MEEIEAELVIVVTLNWNEFEKGLCGNSVHKSRLIRFELASHTCIAGRYAKFR